MDTKDIISILKASKGTNIKTISVGDIYLEFGENPINLTNQENHVQNSIKTVPINTVQRIPTAHEISEVSDMDELDQEEKEVLADEFTNYHLMASDPVQFEEYQRKIANE